MVATVSQTALAPRTRAFYRQVLGCLGRSSTPFLVGGAYALERYTDISRHTKDLDLFVRPEDCRRVLEILAAGGWRTELTFPHWLGKAFADDDFIDIIFSSGNGVARVDNGWFEHAVADEVLGVPALLCPVEEMIWSKAFVMERERYDGADIFHLIRARGHQLDWRRLLHRFGPHAALLLSHLVLFGFVYPDKQTLVPDWVLNELFRGWEEERRRPPTGERVCQGTLLSREQYLIDISCWGYRDARLPPQGAMSPETIAQWTAAINDEEAARAWIPLNVNAELPGTAASLVEGP